MNFKALLLSAAMALGATGASAATLSTVEPTIGGPTITDSGQFNVVPGLLIPALPPAPPVVVPPTALFSGSGAGTLSTNVTDPILLSASLVSGGTFSALSFSFPGGPVLTGDLIEASDSDGIIQALFGTGSGSAAAAFGDFFVLELTSTGLVDGILDASSPFVGDVEAIVYAVAETAVIPLPAGVWLLLGGLGTLVAIRRRQTV